MFERLPTDLIQLIFSYFRSDELAALAPVCRRINAQATLTFVRLLNRYGLNSDIRGYGGYREALAIERVMVQSSWSYQERMRELRQILEMFEQQLNYMLPLRTNFVPRNINPDLTQWNPQAAVRYQYQQVAGKDENPPYWVGVDSANPQEIVALVDASDMVQSLLALIEGLESGQSLLPFDPQTRLPKNT